MTLFPLALAALLGAQQAIDDFSYANSQGARQAWIAAEGTPPVEAVKDADRPAVKLFAPFADLPRLGRVVIDRRVQLDLSAPGEFTLDVGADVPQAFAHLTLYFHSGNGWYAAPGALTKPGWQTLRFSKMSFTTEDTPGGWHSIDTIRIAAWRGQSKNGSLQFRHLAARSHDIALVVPSRANARDDGELRTSAETTDRVGAMLEELGLGADTLDDDAMAHGALGARRVALLAYHPRLSDQGANALVKFVESGGKLLVCYHLPPRLGTTLGFASTQYVRQQRTGSFAEIRFQPADIAGMPKQVRQASWNITVAAPAGHNARIVGHWFDDAGQPTGHAALLVSDRGAFFSHIVLGDDAAAKKQMLAAILGQLAPPLWQQMAITTLERTGRIGHFDDLQSLAAWVNSQGQPAAQERLTAALAARDQAQRQGAEQQYAQAIASAEQAHRGFAEAYLRAQPSPPREGRAVWNHSGTGAYAGDWERSARELEAAGFNMLLPNMLWGGLAHYASDILPRSDTFRRYGDQIEQCLAAAKRHNLEVHVWKVNYNLSTAPSGFVEKMRRENRLLLSLQGKSHPWLCPSHPENQKLELDSMLEVARKYAVHGLHFDYIRYPGNEYCYCEGCRARFEADSARKVNDWPTECSTGPRRQEYTTWRCNQITALVGAVHREAKKLRPEIKISAAVFGAYPACREGVLQDWPEWVKSGYLDFLCPMDYTESDLFFASLVENQQNLVGRRIPIYPGIGATASRSSLAADRVAGQIHHARSLGARGFCIFNFQPDTARALIPDLGLGVGSQKAIPPHRTP